MGLFLVGRHRRICITVSLYEHACKEVCDVKPGIDPYHLLAPSSDRWLPDFVTFTAYQNTDKTSRARALYPDKTLLVSILCIKNTDKARVLLKFWSRRRTKGSSRQRKFFKARQCLPHALGACGGRVWEGGHPSHRGVRVAFPWKNFAIWSS